MNRQLASAPVKKSSARLDSFARGAALWFVSLFSTVLFLYGVLGLIFIYLNNEGDGSGFWTNQGALQVLADIMIFGVLWLVSIIALGHYYYRRQTKSLLFKHWQTRIVITLFICAVICLAQQQYLQHLITINGFTQPGEPQFQISLTSLICCGIATLGLISLTTFRKNHSTAVNNLQPVVANLPSPPSWPPPTPQPSQEKLPLDYPVSPDQRD